MALHPEHELHRRRSGRNIGLALVLVLFVALVFGLSVVKIKQGDLMQGFDHRPPSLPPAAAVAPSANPVAAPGTPASALPQARSTPAAPAAEGGQP